MSHCFLTGRRRVHPVFPSVSPSVRCSVVFVVRSLVQTVGFFLSSQTTDKKEKESHLSDPLTSDPPSSRFCRSSSGFGPLSGVRVCVQVRGLVCPGVWRTRFLFRPVSPLRSISFSLSHSFNRSFSLGPDSDQRLLEERADIYCSGAEGQEYGGPTLSKSKLNKEINDSKNNIKNKRTE